jgi:hypothetical protein
MLLLSGLVTRPKFLPLRRAWFLIEKSEPLSFLPGPFGCVVVSTEASYALAGERCPNT